MNIKPNGYKRNKGQHIVVKVVDHVFFGTKQVKEHHLVYWEKHGVVPDWKNKREVIHHVNGDSHDNRIENLVLMTQSEHVSFHSPMAGKKHSDKTKAKMSSQRIGNKNRLGMKHTQEAKEKISKGSLAAWSDRKMKGTHHA